MSVKAIVGTNWDGEGRGRIMDVPVQDADIVVRSQGGANAGHTIINHYGRFALHPLPSGVFPENITNVIGNGVTFHIPSFVKEFASIEARGVPAPRILASDRVQLLMPYHILQDSYGEARLAGKAFGLMKSGIVPFYSDKYAKIDIQAAELLDEEALREKVENICTTKNALFVHLYHQEPPKADEVMQAPTERHETIAPYLANTGTLLTEAFRAGKTVLVGGQLGSLKDPDQGIYPMVTSSYTMAAFAAVGAAFPPYELKDTVMVTKAYSSAIGVGKLVSEILDETEAEELRKRGDDKGEYGATTGRPRRVGWFDAVVIRYGCCVQGSMEVVLTVPDVFGYLDEIPVCTGYELDGEVIDYFPVTPFLKRCKPVLTVLPGRKEDTRGVTRYKELPESCRRYVESIEKEIGVPIMMVSNGPGREELTYRKK